MKKLILLFALISNVSFAQGVVCEDLLNDDSVVLCRQNKRILRLLNGSGSSGRDVVGKIEFFTSYNCDRSSRHKDGDIIFFRSKSENKVICEIAGSGQRDVIASFRVTYRGTSKCRNESRIPHGSICKSELRALGLLD